MHTTHSPASITPATISPATWWRTPCAVLPWLYLCGDLDTSRPAKGLAQLEEWVRLGITDIIDVRIEWSDEGFVVTYGPSIGYHWIGTDDDGGDQSDDWFDSIVEVAIATTADPTAKMLIHCHMGVNRAPSAALAVLLSMGWDVVDAMDAIRRARPIAGILYAHDALSWWHRRSGTGATEAAADHARVDEWFAKNPVDLRWIISRIRLAECA